MSCIRVILVYVFTEECVTSRLGVLRVDYQLLSLCYLFCKVFAKRVMHCVTCMAAQSMRMVISKKGKIKISILAKLVLTTMEVALRDDALIIK